MSRFITQGLFAVLSLTFFSQAARADVVVKLTSPEAGIVVGNELDLNVNVSSLFEVASVLAAVGDRTAELDEGESGSYTGKLLLSGIEPGEQTVAVTATDVYGNKARAELAFVLDRAPVIGLSHDDVARPKLRIVVTCSDDDAAGCASLTVSPLDLTGTDTIDHTVSLQDYEGGSVALQITATDSRGQTTTIERTVFVDSSPKLERVLTSANGLVVQTDGVRALVISEDASRIFVDSKDGSIAIHDGAAGSVLRASLGPNGAVFSIKSGDQEEVRWRKGASLMLLANTSDFQVRGKWAVVKRLIPSQLKVYDLVLIDLESGAEVLHTALANPGEDVLPYAYALADNGDLVWLDAAFQLFRYRASEVASLSCCGTTAEPAFLTTDGVNIAYQAKDAAATHLLSSVGPETLCTSADVSVCGPYVLRNGFTVFGKPVKQGSSTRYQVFRRAADGAVTKISAFAADSFVSAVSPSGQVVMHSGERRYLTQGSAAPMDIGSTRGSIMWAQDWYVMLGRTLFRVNPEGVAVPEDEPDAGVADAGVTPNAEADAGGESDAGTPPTGADSAKDPDDERGTSRGGKAPGTTCAVGRSSEGATSLWGLSLMLTLVFLTRSMRTRKA